MERAPGGTTDRAVALLLVQLAELSHPDEAIAQARAELPRNHWMPTVISVLLKHAPQDDQAQLALDALAAIQRLSPSRDERGVMFDLAIDAMDAPRPALLEWIKESLRQLSHSPRSSCSETSPASAP